MAEGPGLTKPSVGNQSGPHKVVYLVERGRGDMKLSESRYG